MTNISRAIQLLPPGQTLNIKPQGNSMCPCFMGGRDEVFVKAPSYPLHRGDIAVFLRDDGTYVIHRICKITSNSYYMLGDNQTEIEGPIREDQIHAIVESFTRKGRSIDCQKNRIYRLYVKLWLFFRPIRPAFQKFAKIMRRILHR